jgi:excisionase family DNA binding protein
MAEWMSLDEICRYLKKPKSTLYKLAQQGRLPGHKLGRSWRFDREEVDFWIKSGGQQQARSRTKDAMPS